MSFQSGDQIKINDNNNKVDFNLLDKKNLLIEIKFHFKYLMISPGFRCYF